VQVVIKWTPKNCCKSKRSSLAESPFVRGFDGQIKAGSVHFVYSCLSRIPTKGATLSGRKTPPSRHTAWSADDALSFGPLKALAQSPSSLRHNIRLNFASDFSLSYATPLRKSLTNENKLSKWLGDGGRRSQHIRNTVVSETRLVDTNKMKDQSVRATRRRVVYLHRGHIFEME
jgi:hypothetical protein